MLRSQRISNQALLGPCNPPTGSIRSVFCCRATTVTEARTDLDRDTYFIPVVAIPVVMDLCRKANTIVIGSIVITVMVRIRFH